MATKQFIGIDDALQRGMTLSAFRSAGGLRVVQIENPTLKGKKRFVGVGAMPNLRPALILASKDFQAGGTPAEVHYLTGSITSEDNLDSWVGRGRTLFASYRGIAYKGKVRIEARDANERPVFHVDAKHFSSAYNTLCDKVTNRI